MRVYLAAAAALLLQHTHALTFPKFELSKPAPPPTPVTPAPRSLFGPTIRKAQIADLEPLAETRLQASPFAAGYAIASRKEAGEKLSDFFCRGIEKGDTVATWPWRTTISSRTKTSRCAAERGLPKCYLKNLFVDEGIGGEVLAGNYCKRARRSKALGRAYSGSRVENDNDQAARLCSDGFEDRASLASFEARGASRRYFLEDRSSEGQRRRRSRGRGSSVGRCC